MSHLSGLLILFIFYQNKIKLIKRERDTSFQSILDSLIKTFKISKFLIFFASKYVSNSKN